MKKTTYRRGDKVSSWDGIFGGIGKVVRGIPDRWGNIVVKARNGRKYWVSEAEMSPASEEKDVFHAQK